MTDPLSDPCGVGHPDEARRLRDTWILRARSLRKSATPNSCRIANQAEDSVLFDRARLLEECADELEALLVRQPVPPPGAVQATNLPPLVEQSVASIRARYEDKYQEVGRADVGYLLCAVDALRLQRPAAVPAAQDARPTAFDFLAHLQRQREWSERTFGPGTRTMGVIDHIRKELREIEADPTDVKEWIDVVILGLDGAWRAGYTPQQIADALAAKQAKNEARQWPDWRTRSADEAIEHDRSLDAPASHPSRQEPPHEQ